jgi:hypothetical protein
MPYALAKDARLSRSHLYIVRCEDEIPVVDEIFTRLAIRRACRTSVQWHEALAALSGKANRFTRRAATGANQPTFLTRSFSESVTMSTSR